jgi:pimeloyl-ACP methyl ester carboxylesterase
MSATQSDPLLAVPSGGVLLEGVLELPQRAFGMVIFSHGSGSGRHSPRNRYVAQALQRAGLGTLLLDLLTPDEERDYEMRFNIDLLTTRLLDAVQFVRTHRPTHSLGVGLFGASTGAASALRVAAAMPLEVKAVVSRGGRADLTGARTLALVHAPTLLLVGGQDHLVIDLNRTAYESLRCTKELHIVPGATHLFEEPGALEDVARLAVEWLSHHLAPTSVRHT